MGAHDLVGVVLVAGLVVFLVGAAAWRLAYERRLAEALRVIHADRRRRAWIHLWMVAGVFCTAAGIGAFAVLLDDRRAVAAAVVAAVVYGLGALCWVVSLAFRLAVVPWAAQRTVEDGEPPAVFPPLDRWAGVLYLVHMASAYLAFAATGWAVLLAGGLAPWLGWLGVGGGSVFLAGFVLTRFAGPFNPPFWAHAYTGVLGVVLLTTA